MLIVNTEVRPSPIHGTGLFAKENLRAQQIIWVMHKSFDVAFSKKEWEALPPPAKEYLHTYMYWSARLEKYVACLDNSRHMNHCESPNTESIYFDSQKQMPVAMKDSVHFTDEQWSMIEFCEGFVITTKVVRADEELLCNYNLDFPDLGGAGTLDFLRKTKG